MANIQDRVLAGRIETVVAQLPLSALANLINSGIAAFVLSPLWPASWLLAWVAAIIGISALRVAVWLLCRQGISEPAKAVRVSRALTALAGVSGLLWGVPGMLIFASAPVELQGFIVFVLGGMSAGAVSTLAGHLPAFLAYVVPALVPIILRLMFDGGVLHLSMGAMGTMYLLVLVAAGANLNRTLTRQLTLQFEKSDLVDDLTRARNEAESASRAKSAFLATVSHELRTPLNAVLGFTQVMEREVHGPLGHNAYRDYVRHITSSGTHLLTLINELLDLSRAEHGRLEIEESEVDLAQLLHDCVELMALGAEHSGLDLDVVIAPSLPNLRADPRRIKQVVLNVLSNAIKFTRTGGRIELQAARAPAGELTVKVHDDGIGMTESELTVAMESFGRADNSHSRTTEGTGIGLPFTAFLMDLHGGRVTIDSTPGEGTVVNLHFPAERIIESSGSGRDAVASKAQERESA